MIGRGPVKILIALLLVLVAAAIDAQEDQFSLGLERLPLTAVSDDGTEARANFSRVYGEHATFFISAEGVERYGEDASDFGPVNFFGE